MRIILINQCSLVVSSCDKYETAWYPYFELIIKYWKDHPKEIYLISETKSYYHERLQIHCVNPGIQTTWSERLYQCLSQIKTKYIIFSLEDFFLLAPVRSNRIEECLSWMNENPDIAVCRLAVSNDPALIPTNEYRDFYIAGNTVAYRLDTQFAIWDKEALMSFLVLSENPWQFEEIGTKRILNSKKIFLWKYAENDFDLDNMVVPYRINQQYGFGIAWGNWLWNDKKWFEENGIYNVNYKKLGMLSKRCVQRRFKYLYQQNTDTVGTVIQYIFRLIVKFKKCFQNIRIYGWKQGLKVSMCSFLSNK